MPELNVTLALIAITGLVSFQAFNNPELRSKLIFNPFVAQSRGEWYRFLSHALLHADMRHLLVNMFVLWMFGSTVELLFEGLTGAWGIGLFIALYVGGVAFSALPAYLKHRGNPGYNSLGASGATSAVLFSYVLMLPFEELQFIFFPIFGFPAWVFGLAYLGYEYYMDKKSSDNIAHDAHFFGALYGIVFTTLLNPELVTNFGYLSKLIVR